MIMFKLYYANGNPSIPDYDVERVALQLAYQDIYVSSEIVELAARCLVNEGKIPPFTVVTESGEYKINDYGRYSEDYPPEFFTFENLLDRLLFND